MKEMLRHDSISAVMVHTGQHYDYAMSDRLFADLELAPPEVNLGVGSGTHAEQTAEVMLRLEPVMKEHIPDLLLVVGDVNSTLAAALVAAKLGIPVAHVEAGLRSFDRRMPEELNRILTDSLSDLLFVTEESGRRNLAREGIDPSKIHFVGNVMIDALEAARPRWERSEIHSLLGIDRDRSYALLTLHRPSNVDDAETFDGVLGALRRAARGIPIILPVHPRARRRFLDLEEATWLDAGSGRRLPDGGIVCVEPMGYLDFIALESRASLVLTDSGGVQEETTVLGVPCLTLRETTERPITADQGTNRVIGTDPERIVDEIATALANPPILSRPPALWDGKASQRIVQVILGRRWTYAPRAVVARRSA
jgi:UDP-N-acetylglucosamine 2-epimerase (non-hydrolysing)